MIIDREDLKLRETFIAEELTQSAICVLVHLILNKNYTSFSLQNLILTAYIECANNVGPPVSLQFVVKCIKCKSLKRVISDLYSLHNCSL